MPESPPIPQKKSHPTTLHGIERDDPYAWLRDDNWQEVMRDPSVLRAEIRAHLEAENAWAKQVMAPTEKLQEQLFAEMKGRIKEDDASVPTRDGPWAYFRRYETGGQHPHIVRQRPDGSDVQVLIDGDAEAKGHAYYQLAAASHAPDHRRMAYAYDDKGSEFHTLHVRNLDDGTHGPVISDRASGSLAWSRDGRQLFYVVLDDQHRPCKVFRHEVGTDPSTDTLVYEETDPGFFLGVGETEGRGHIVIDAHDHTTSEVRIIPGDSPTAAPVLVAAREAGVEYELSQQGDEFVILTNVDGAEDFKVMRAPVATPQREHWRDDVAHQSGRLILGVQTFAEYTVRLERVDGLPRIAIEDRQGNAHEIALDEEAYSLGLSGGWEYDTTLVRYSYSSPTTPLQVYDYDMATRSRTLLKEQEVPSGHDASQYRCARLHAPAADGQTVPVTVLWHVDTPIDGSAPCLLYGYGSYGHAMPAAFATGRLSLVDRGFVYAIAHVRGGKDKGYRWYTDGKLAKKMNTFTDFVAAAEHLVAEGYTAKGNITIEGGSAGGMLVGAAANLRPDLWCAVVAAVPFVDVMTTMCTAALPLTPPEWPEWGNPIDSEEAYRTIASYSPIDNVTAQAYPHILVTAGLTDPRVTYWEPAKWVATLREKRTNDNMLLLRTYMEAGHAGAAGRFDRLKEDAFDYAFVLLANGKV